jgi:hypothetical protein
MPAPMLALRRDYSMERPCHQYRVGEPLLTPRPPLLSPSERRGGAASAAEVRSDHDQVLRVAGLRRRVLRRGPVRGVAGAFYHREHIVKVSEYLLIVKANDAIASSLEVLGSLGVLCPAEAVGCSIELYGEIGSVAVEIDDESPERVLPPELEACESTVSQAVLEDRLRLGHLPSELSRPLVNLGAGPVAVLIGCHVPPA